jgi:uncharacterized protein DUF3857/uncharacterized protein DUF2569/transglutaminase superfamily protein
VPAEIVVTVNLAPLLKIGFNPLRRMRKSVSSIPILFLGCVFLASILGCPGRAVAAEREFSIEPIPAWTSSIAVDTNQNALEESASAGVFYLLVDTEINGGTKERFLHFAKKFLSPAGVEANSRLSFEFDPAYEKLILHKIVIHRGTQILDQLDPAKIRVIQEEKDLDRLIYNGARTAFLFLEDVRVGDWVEFAFTIRGRNPLQKNHYYDALQLRWPFPVQSENYRLLWPRTNQPLWLQMIGDAPQNHQLTGAFHEYAWHWENRPVQEMEDFVPPGTFAYTVVQFTDFDSWEDVAIWASDVFRAQAPSKELEEKMRAFQLQESTPEERVLKVLQFVQDSIRYLGIENGINSHTPTDPSVVLARGYGDCKDKALLFCTLVRSMGIEAAPVLVSTRLKGRVKSLKPTPWTFDHVIVRVVLPGKTNYVDVTRTFQRGPLDKHYVDPFGAGVLLSDLSTGMIDIPFQKGGLPTTIIEENFNIPTNAPTRLTIEKTFDGADADLVRQQLAMSGHDTLTKNALVYYRKYYPDITSDGPVQALDNPDLNRVRLIERFIIPAIWKPARQTNYITCEFVADGLLDRLFNPSKKERKQPLAVPFPQGYYHRIEIETPDLWRVIPDDKKIQTKAFVYVHRTSLTNNRVVIVNQLGTLTPGVDAVDVPAYVEALNQIPQNLTFAVTKPVRGAYTGGGSPNWVIWIAVISYSTVVLMASVLVYRWKFKNPPLVPYGYSHLQGLGGWLIPVGFGRVVGILVRLGLLAKVAPVYSSERWQVITNSASASYDSMLPPVLLFELFNNITLLIFSILLFVVFFQKKRIFPALFVTYLTLQFVFYALDVFLNYYLHRNSVLNHTNSVSSAALAPLLMGVIIWGLYISRSRRVKLTFVN